MQDQNKYDNDVILLYKSTEVFEVSVKLKKLFASKATIISNKLITPNHHPQASPPNISINSSIINRSRSSVCMLGDNAWGGVGVGVDG
jgi:hypothetical protein